MNKGPIHKCSACSRNSYRYVLWQCKACGGWHCSESCERVSHGKGRR
jgi:hypothetical protein